MAETPDYKVKVAGDTAYVTTEPNSKTTTSKLDVEARKALPGAKLFFVGHTVKGGKPRKGVRVYKSVL
jgi:hypothetical protein